MVIAGYFRQEAVALREPVFVNYTTYHFSVINIPWIIRPIKSSGQLWRFIMNSGVVFLSRSIKRRSNLNSAIEGSHSVLKQKCQSFTKAEGSGHHIEPILFVTNRSSSS